MSIDLNEIKYKFFITEIRVNENIGNHDYVIGKIKWLCAMNYQGAKTKVAGETAIPYNPDAEFKPITDVTAEEAINWLIMAEGGDNFIHMLKTNVTAQLLQIKSDSEMIKWEIPLIGQDIVEKTSV